MIPPGYPNLSDEILNQIREWMNANPNRLISVKFGSAIFCHDMRCLQMPAPNVNPRDLWLSDQIINKYLELVVHHHSSPDNQTNMKVFPTQFWRNLRDKGYTTAQKVTGQGFDMFTCNTVFVIIPNKRKHYGLGVIHPRLREIKYYNFSNRSSDSTDNVLMKLEEYVISDSRFQHGKQFDTSRWLIYNVPDVPKQIKGHDCGVFVCATAEAIARDDDFMFTNEHVHYLRSKIAYEIGADRIIS